LSENATKAEGLNEKEDDNILLFSPKVVKIAKRLFDFFSAKIEVTANF